jgi:hypothetical protein
MMKATSWVAAAAVALPIAAAGLWLGALPGTGAAAGDDSKAWRAVAKKPDLEKLVKAAADQLKSDLTGLAGGKLDKKTADTTTRRATYLSLLVAAYGQSDPKEFAATRDLALKIHEEIKAGQVKEAAADVAKLSTVKDPSAKTEVVELVKVADRDDARAGVMSLFKHRMRGGIGVSPKPAQPNLDGIESRLNTFATKLKPTDINDDLRLMALQVAALAELTGAIGPDKVEGKKTPAKWKELSNQMLDASEKFAAAVTAKKDKDVKAALMAVNNSCTSCHETFRD